MVADAGGYVGQIHMGQEQFPLKAHEEAGRLAGAFSSKGHDYDFTATREGEGLTLVTAGTRYELKKVAPPAANPLAEASGGGAVEAGLPGYSVINSTDAGKSLSGTKAKATSAQSALEQTFSDLAHYFDARPVVSGAFEDTKEHLTGGASFKAKLKGQDVKGFVSCKPDDQGVAVAVVYCRADAAAGAWDKLTAAPAEASGGGDTSGIKLQEYKFPDDTGSVGVAEGWKTNAPSALGAVRIEGPAEQRVVIGFSMRVLTPDSQIAQMIRQNEIRAQRMGMKPPPPAPFVFAPQSGPSEALAAIIPQLSRMNEQANGFTFALEKIISEKEVKPNLPDGKAALVCFDLAKTTRGVAAHFRTLARVETVGLGQGAWMYSAIEATAPVASFDADQPVMLAMINSLKENVEVIQKKSQAMLDAQAKQARDNLAISNQQFQEQQKQRSAAQQEAHRTQMAGYDAHNQAWRAGQVDKSRHNADVVEMIRGYRTVEDTRTGTKASVDYYNVDGIVNRLNETDPGRYKQIPLRDEVAPLPSGQ